VAVAVGTEDSKLEPEALNEIDRLELYVWANESHRHSLLRGLLLQTMAEDNGAFFKI
jgi:hypothetical protein